MSQTSRSSVVAFVISSVVVAGSLGACVGNDPQVETPVGSNGEDAGGRIDSGGNPPPVEAGSPIDAGSSEKDAAPTCGKDETLCGASCVVISRDAENCGTCGRSCGGGTCSDSACSIATVRDGIADLHGFTVDGGALYFTSADKVFSCTADKCTSPNQLAAMIGYPAEDIEVDAGFLYFKSAPNQNTERPAIFRCPVTGCPNPPSAIVGDGLNGVGDIATSKQSLFTVLFGSGLNWVDCSSGTCAKTVVVVAKPVGTFAVDAQNIYFQDLTGGGAALSSCPIAASCTRTSFGAPTSVMGPIRVAGDKVYFVGPGVSSGTNGVYACGTTGPCAKPTALTKTTDVIPNLAADTAGIYWTQGDKLLSCASAACPGGAKTLAQGLTNVGLLRLDKQFVYFRTDGSVSGTSAIKRLARP